jgi:hypothetical protein
MNCSTKGIANGSLVQCNFHLVMGGTSLAASP